MSIKFNTNNDTINNQLTTLHIVFPPVQHSFFYQSILVRELKMYEFACTAHHLKIKFF